MKLEEGRYRAKIVDHGMFTSRKGTLGVNVTFEVQDYDIERKPIINWVSWMSGGATEYTLEGLGKMGFNPHKKELTDLLRESTDAPIILDTQTEFEITLENESYLDGEGNEKTNLKVKYVNLPGESPFQKVNKGELAALLKSSGARDAFTKFKGKVAADDRRAQTLGKNAKPESDAPF